MNRRNLLKTILSLPALLFVKPEPEPEYKVYRTYTCVSNDCSCSKYDWTSGDYIITKFNED